MAKVPRLTGEPFPTELLLRLKHMIVSHHGTYELGSPKLPMTPEAIALHYRDNFDAKVHNITRDIHEDHNALSPWTPFNPQTQRKLFKGSVEGGDSYTRTLEPADGRRWRSGRGPSGRDLLAGTPRGLRINGWAFV
jgi:3'-5' exoribonuclease